MADENKNKSLTELVEMRDKISLDLVDVYWEMKPPKEAKEKELSEFSTLARIAGERGKIGMKAIEKLEILILAAKKIKPQNDVASLSDEEIKLVMEYRKNGGRTKSTSA